ncbi:MAG: hypothetical protein M3367_04540 [Acidobacteriota bacterium]|nr:hypothetical protein [Acidobacteriota bacterium]
MRMQLRTANIKLDGDQSGITQKSDWQTGNLISLSLKSLKLLRRSLFILLMISGSLVGTMLAQDKQDTDNNADQTLRSSGRVNPSSFGLEMDIPLGAYPGRGINVPVSISYSSKVWRMDFQSSEPVTPGCTSVWDPKYSEDSASGWTSSMGAAYIEYTGEDNIYDATYGHPISDACDPQNPVTTYAYFKRIQIHLPSGESHELRASDTPTTYSSTDPNYVKDMAGTYYSTDGSKLKYVENGATKRLYLPNGSYYDFAASKALVNQKTIRTAALYKDINGNQLTYYAGNTTYPNGYWIDTLNRTIPVPLPVKEPTATGVVNYNMPGFNGGTLVYKFHWKQLKGGTAADSGLTDFSQTLRYKGDFYDLNSPYRNASDALFHSEFRNRARSFSSEPVFNPIVLTAVELPNNQKYEFSYNIYGEIDRIKYPTGGEETFQFLAVKAVGAFDTNKPNEEANRGVTQRNVYESSGAAPYPWSYSSGTSQTGNNLKRTITAPDGTRAERDLYMGYSQSGLFGSWGFSNVLTGMAYEERSYASGAGQLLSNQKTTWAKTEFTMSNSSVNPQWHPRVTKVENIIYDLSGNALSSTSTMDYAGTLTEIDNHLDVNLTKHYGFTTGLGSFGALEKQIETVFMEYDGAINWTEYESRHLISLPTQTFVKNAAGTTLSKAEIKYDESDYGSGGYRGQPTTVRSWLDTTSTWLEAHSKYDGYGNVIETTDAKGNKTTTEYSATYSYAYPTKVTTAVPDPSGVNGSNTAFITEATFDLTTGLPISTKDANNLETRMEYNDPLLRPTKVQNYFDELPVGGASETVYGVGTSAATRFVKTRAQIDETKWKEGYSWYDGLGRTYKTQSVDSTGDVFAKTLFDNFGRVWKTSNPYRGENTPDNQLEWTERFYDTAGRLWKVKTPDSAEVETAYSLATTGSQLGTVVTVNDQAEKQRRSITNALGQLTRVDEPIAAGLGPVNAPNLATDYTYDTLGNLTSVQQFTNAATTTCGNPAPVGCRQLRGFTYDSLSRLKTASNPESGGIFYTYDDNGNLATKADARGVVTNYTYDALNRVTNRSYSAPANLPNYENSLPVTYTYDNLPNAKGRLTKVVTGAVATPFSVIDYQVFDKLGRVTQSQQTTDGTAYNPQTYTYNLSGALIEEKYPSGRVVKNVLDNDGDLSMVQSKKNASSAFSNYATDFTYTAAGAVSSMQLGNLKRESTQFNSRLQPTQIALGTTLNPTELLKLDYEYGTLVAGQTSPGTNNGNISKQFITVPAAGQTPGFTATQYYDYDELNRLYQASDQFQATGQASVTAWWQVYQYDRYGNRRFNEEFTTTLTKGCGTPPTVCPADRKRENPEIEPSNNRLKELQDADLVKDYEYDLAGNLIKDARGKTFIYDGENHQTEVIENNISKGKYFYDGDGKRVKKIATINGQEETTIFVYDASGKMVAEYSTTVAPASAAKVSYLTADHLGSPRIITDATGAVISRRDFMPFGEEVPRAGYGSDAVRQKFTAYERDNESELDFAQARYYSSKLGRFYSVDPENAGAREDDPQSWNGYSYTGNNPINFSDQTGLDYRICLANGNGCWTATDEVFAAYIKELPAGFVATGDGLNGSVFDSDGDVVTNYSYFKPADQEIVGQLLEGFASKAEPFVPAIELTQPAPIPAGGAVLGGVAKAAKVAKFGRTLTKAKWAKGIINYSKGAMTAIDHVIFRHGAGTTFKNVSKFTTSSSRKIQKLADQAVSNLNGSQFPGPDGGVIYDFGRIIGTHSDGTLTSKVQVFFNSAGEIMTMYPVK